MSPRARIGLALCAVLFASPLFLACRSATVTSDDPEVQASSGREAVEAMAMPEDTTAQKKAKHEALADVVDKISGPILDHCWEIGEFEFMPGNGTYVSTRVDRQTICSFTGTPQSGTSRASLSRRQYPNLYRLFDAEKRLGRELHGGETDASDSPEREATQLLEMPEDTIAEKETKRVFLQGTMWEIAEPIIRHRFDTHDYEVISDFHPYTPTVEDHEIICMYSMSPQYGTRRVSLPRSQYPDLYRLFDELRRLDREIAGGIPRASAKKSAALRFADILSMPESNRTEIEAKAKAFSDALSVHTRPAFDARIAAALFDPPDESYELLDEQKPRTVTLGTLNLSLWTSNQAGELVKVTLPRSEHPDLYELQDRLSLLRKQIGDFEHEDFMSKREEQNARMRGPISGPIYVDNQAQAEASKPR